MQKYPDPPGQPPKAPLTGFTIGDQLEVTELDPKGRAVRGVRVAYTLNGGPSGTVFVPESMYTVANVQAAVAAAAATRAQVQNLTG